LARRVKKRPAVFIDRDGTLIREKNYLSKIKDVQLIKGAVEAVKLLKSSGYKVIVLTNQSGIGRGYFTEPELLKVHAFLVKLLKKKGVILDGIYYCPHHPDADCSCRKPKTGMVIKAKRKLNLDLESSYTIGDHKGDFLLGQNMGGKGIFVLTGHGKHELKKIKAEPEKYIPDHISSNILSAAKWIIKDSCK
jgi:D-glycero-D-manno-heptose 1,7-bisphosphate phosphatase